MTLLAGSAALRTPSTNTPITAILTAMRSIVSGVHSAYPVQYSYNSSWPTGDNEDLPGGSGWTASTWPRAAPERPTRPPGTIRKPPVSCPPRRTTPTSPSATHTLRPASSLQGRGPGEWSLPDAYSASTGNSRVLFGFHASCHLLVQSLWAKRIRSAIHTRVLISSPTTSLAR